ncbi:glycosyltransferase family 39 protein [Streptomyces collinus]|uniref:glycosyltransferase family 39 protein n=1 Tax=Streptomyces collinus TaxID=42684 RepID=UPI0036C10EBA
MDPPSRAGAGGAGGPPAGGTAAGAGRVPGRVRRALAVCTPASAMLALGLWGLDRSGMWRDEAVTFQVARRTVPQIWRLLHGVDAVHGLYYLLMHAVLTVHPGEVVLRLPSVCAAALTAGLVAALGARLVRPRAGLWAGLLYAVSPMAGHYAQEGRSYALVAAGATGATLLFVRAVRAARKSSWWAYGVVLGLTCWLHEFAVLLLLAHALSLALARAGARAWRGWGCAAVAVGAVLVPMVLVSRAQSAQVAWLREPTWDTAAGLLRSCLGPTDGVYAVCLVLAAVGLTGMAGRRGEPTCAGVALPLLVVPPAALMLASQVAPLYVDRYVLYALSGAPLLVAAGAERVAAAVDRRLADGRRTRVALPGHTAPAALSSCPAPRSPRPSRLRALGPALAGAVAVLLALTHQWPLLRDDRDPARRPDDLAAVSRAAGRMLRPGGAVLFLPAQTRNVALTYPGAFRGARDLALAGPAPASGTLYGTEVGAAELRRRTDRLERVWVLADRDLLAGRWRVNDATERAKLAVLAHDFVPGPERVRGDVTVRLYVRGAAVTRSPAPPTAPPRPVPR